MGTGEVGDTVTFTRTLAALKREGSNILVTGDDVRDVHRAECETLFGERMIDRRRTVVSAVRENTAECSHDPTGARRIEYRAATRSTTAATGESPIDTGDSPAAPSVARDLPSLETAIADAIDEANRIMEGLAPAQFRLCFDSLGPLLEAHDEQSVVRFLHAVTGDIRAVDGMGHYHLAMPHDTNLVRTIEPLFDATVELRADGEPQQRWRLVDQDTETTWLPV